MPLVTCGISLTVFMTFVLFFEGMFLHGGRGNVCHRTITTRVGNVGNTVALLLHWTEKLRVDCLACDAAILRVSSTPGDGYFRLACSISIRSVCVGALPLQCLWYRNSSPLLASE